MSSTIHITVSPDSYACPVTLCGHRVTGSPVEVVAKTCPKCVEISSQEPNVGLVNRTPLLCRPGDVQTEPCGYDYLADVAFATRRADAWRDKLKAENAKIAADWDREAAAQAAEANP